MRGLLRDISFSIRSLRRTPRYVYIAVCTLAVGIAANTIVFSFINTAILTVIPYPNPERLAILSWHSNRGMLSRDISASAFLLLRDRARSFESIAAIHDVNPGVNLSAAGRVHYARALGVSGDFFRTLEVFPVTGQSFSRQEEQLDRSQTAVLSYALWAQDFGKAPSVLGQDIRINGEPYTVIGVMPVGFHSYPDADLWIPLPLRPAATDPGNNYRVIARFKEGITPEQAQHELDSAVEYSATYQLRDQVSNPRLVISRLQPFMVARVQQGLALLFGAVLFVLLIACTNLAVLMTVRTSARSQETAIRLALGATRWRLIRIFLVESLIISTLGGTLGLILAKEMIPAVAWLVPLDAPLATNRAIDARVICFTFVLSIFTGLLFGLAPALRMSHRKVVELLRLSSNTVTRSVPQVRVGRVLVVAQSALTFMLLTVVGLFLRSFLALHAIQPGFASDGIWVAQLSLASQRYQTTASTARLLDQLCDQVQYLNQAEICASTVGLPLESGPNLVVHPTETPQENVYVEYRAVSSGYFQIMQIGLLEGRPFSPSDTIRNAPVAIVNQSLARRWWPGKPAVGHFTSISSELGPAFSDPPRRVIGVAADIHETDLAQSPSPTIYVPVDQVPDRTTEFTNGSLLTSIIVRTSDPGSMLERLRKGVSDADPDLSVASFRAFAQIVYESLARRLFYTTLITASGIFALLLTAIGVYGLFNYQLALRAREIGIRMALGARRSKLVNLVVKEGILLVGIGILIALPAAPFESRLTGIMLYNGPDKFNLSVLVIAAAVLEIVAAVTSLAAAVRTTSIEPMVALRTE